MKQTMEVGVVLAVAVAAARCVGAPSQGAPAGEARVVASVVRSTNHPKPVDASYAGGCSAFEGKTAGKEAAQDPNHGAASAALDKFLAIDHSLPVKAEAHAQRFAGVQFAVATAPDPRHTNLALGFDREMVLLQEAAQDDGFTYNSSWLPWTGEAATFPLLADQQRNDDRRDEREACPGILLFRKGVVQPTKTDNGVADPYAKGLIVFVVGEQPTGGVNEEQWANTMHWLATNVPIPSVSAKTSLNILGPNFSGSLPSVERDLAKLYADPPSSGSDAATLRKRFATVRLLSGGVSSCSSILWFQGQLEQPSFGGRVLFGSFAENDDVQIYRFLQYEQAQGTDLDQMAILSEDETAYANPPVDRAAYANPPLPQRTNREPARCATAENPDGRPVRLSYPRDISAVRAAYDKQAIFNARTASAARPILKEDPDLESPNDQATDTIHSYSGSLSAIAQEAVLYGIVTTLRTHHTRFLLLRCSNPLDFLFLTRFFHQAYPEARIVTVTSDQLFRREIDTTEFRGVLALANYPLLSRNGHWSRLSEVSGPASLHTHRVFDANNEGTYIAGRYLFDPKQWEATPAGGGHLALPLLEDLPDYADPFWMTRPLCPPAETNAPVWLSVLGRDGYWPVAVLNERTTPATKPFIKPPPSTILRLTTNLGVHYDLARQADPKAQPRFSKSLLFAFPFAWTLSVVLACGLLLFQLFAIASDSGLTSSGLFAPFRHIPSFPSQAILLGLNTTFATMPALLLFSVAMVVPRLDYVDKMGRNFWFWLDVCGLAISGLMFTLLLHREMRKIPVTGNEAPRQETVLRLRPDGGLAASVYVGSLLVLGALAASILRSSHKSSQRRGTFCAHGAPYLRRIAARAAATDPAWFLSLDVAGAGGQCVTGRRTTALAGLPRPRGEPTPQRPEPFVCLAPVPASGA